MHGGIAEAPLAASEWTDYKVLMTIRKLHHAAYRCRSSEQTRRFYEDFLGLPLVGAVEIGGNKVLHTFYRMADGSALAFFDAPEMPFEFKTQHDYDLHIAVEVSKADLLRMFDKGKASGIHTRGISDHGFIDSIYFRDPNGYVIELTAKREGAERDVERAKKDARHTLDEWQAEKAKRAA